MSEYQPLEVNRPTLSLAGDHWLSDKTGRPLHDLRVYVGKKQLGFTHLIVTLGDGSQMIATREAIEQHCGNLVGRLYIPMAAFLGR